MAEKKLSLQTCNVFKELRNSGLFCDVTIKAGGKPFPVHRNILAACSPYFRALFTHGTKDTSFGEIKIPGIDSEVMSTVVEYAYTREVSITTKNVVHLFKAADQFNIMGMLHQCVRFLISELSPENCFGFRKFAQAHYCKELIDACIEYIQANFEKIVKIPDAEEYLSLSVEELKQIVSDDDLNIKQEENIFEAIIRWIDKDPVNRQKYAYELLAQVRLGVIGTEYFMAKVKTHPYVQGNEQCRPLILETMKYLYDFDVMFRHPVGKPRRPHDVLFAIGGWSGGNPTNVVESYDTRADSWMIVDTADGTPRAYHCLAVLGHKVYMIGGFDGREYFNSVRCFDPVTKVWSEVAPMNCRRCYVSTAVIGGCIYAMGGFDGHNRMRTAERYTPETNQWSMIEPMNHRRSDSCATVLEGKIYIAGGFNGQECLNNAESYDPVTGIWYEIPPMRYQRSGVGIAALNGHVYAIGGFNGISRLNTGERYSPAANNWTNIPSMYIHRSNFGIGVLDGMIFIIGGFNGSTTIDKVECFESKSNEWLDATEMNVFRSALSIAVVGRLPNRKDYLFPRENSVPQNFPQFPPTEEGAVEGQNVQAQTLQQQQQHQAPLLPPRQRPTLQEQLQAFMNLQPPLQQQQQQENQDGREEDIGDDDEESDVDDDDDDMEPVFGPDRDPNRHRPPRRQGGSTELNEHDEFGFDM